MMKKLSHISLLSRAIMAALLTLVSMFIVLMI